MREHYISYSAIQLASEDKFIAWVMHGAHTDEWEEWLQKNGHVNPMVEDARSIVHDMMSIPEFTIGNEEQVALWDRIAGDMTTSTIRKPILKSKVFRWSTIAAAALIAFLIWSGTKESPVTVAALAGEHKEIQLPESSHIQLNAGSSVVYDAKHFETERELTLVGEAFFKVYPGSRFTVNTSQGSVTVLGTSFNVIAWPDRFEVTCYTGKVKVENPQKDHVMITAGERCSNDETTHKLKSDPFTHETETPQWMSGKFVFNNQSLKIVTEELERQYNVKVKLAPGLEDTLYVGLFESGNLDTALSLITWPFHLTSAIKGDTVWIGR